MSRYERDVQACDEKGDKNEAKKKRGKKAKESYGFSGDSRCLERNVDARANGGG